MVKRREKMKKDELQMSIEIYEKRYQAKDFSGQLLAEYTASTTKTRYVLVLFIAFGIRFLNVGNS
jgi:enhancer of polycomb-like protein